MTEAEREGFQKGFVGYDADGKFVHFCHCGKKASYGHGVKLRENQLGKWYCFAHNPKQKEPSK